MAAIEKLNAANAIYNQHKNTVAAETRTIEQGRRLMQKWDAETLDEAVYMEAKSRAQSAMAAILA